MNAELAEGVLEMLVDRSLGEEELAGDARVRQATTR
jgi:hypothetical protein